MLKELDSMPPDAFLAELRTVLISLYEGILKVPGAGGRPVAKIIKRRFTGKHADAHEPAPAPADGAAADGAAAAGAPDGAPAGGDSRADTPVPEAAPAAASKGRRAAPKGGGSKG
jgi:hypothetical protein